MTLRRTICGRARINCEDAEIARVADYLYEMSMVGEHPLRISNIDICQSASSLVDINVEFEVRGNNTPDQARCAFLNLCGSRHILVYAIEVYVRDEPRPYNGGC